MKLLDSKHVLGQRRRNMERQIATNGVTDYVTVDGMLPAYNTSTTSNGNFLYANDGGDNGAMWLSTTMNYGLH